jgi:hypothetical protein
MKKLTVVGTAVVVVLIIGWIVFRPTQPQAHAVPTSCPAPTTNDCPKVNVDVDANGCPNGGYNPGTGECKVTFGYYKQYAGCKDEPPNKHLPMAFYTTASPGKPSKYHLVSGVFWDQAAFTEIDCATHEVVGPVNMGQPFLPTNDNFSDFEKEHISGDADPAAIGKCFKVTVNPWLVGSCIDPHIIVKGD